MPETFLSARWENLIMANYAVPPELLQPYLPKRVELDYFDKKAYVSLVGFMFKRTRLFHVPVPFLGTFEEINLRFYVKRTESDFVKRGVVFINETVPYKAVAWMANKLYKEHYTAVLTKNETSTTPECKNIKYLWKKAGAWNHLAVTTETLSEPMLPGSIEEFIFEHYYGYTKVNDRVTQEYKVNHPRWLINQVTGHSIQCDFAAMYGSDFAGLSDQRPDSVIFAEGSAVSVNWKRRSF